MILFWERKAQEDREMIFQYFFEHAGLALADQVEAKFESMAELLQANPLLGKPIKNGKKAFRKLVIPHFPFIFIYAVAEQRIMILRVLHTSRKLSGHY